MKHQVHGSFGHRFAIAFARATASFEGYENLDTNRFPHLGSPSLRTRLRNIVDSVLHRLGMVRRGAVKHSHANLAAVLDRFAGLEQVDAMLADRESQKLLIELLVYRVLGPRHVRLSRNTPAYHRIVDELEALGIARSPRAIPNAISRKPWSLIDLEPLGRSLRFHGSLRTVRTQFVLHQYRLDRDGTRLEVEPGDIVIDGGGCYGETALHFADDVGPNGTVLTFEFIPQNLDVLHSNLALNPSLRDRIDLVMHPLWDRAGEEMKFVMAGPGSRSAKISDTLPTVTVRTETIDDVVEKRGIPRIDFIKLDIEGAELKALRGGERVIRRDRPKLAICLYHSLDDFVQIPAWLASLDVGYRFYIDHFTIHAEETVLFAVPTERFK